MSHRHNFDNIVHLRTDNPKSTIRQFFASVMCITCGEQTNKEICAECLSQPNRTILVLLDKIRQLERTYQQITNVSMMEHRIFIIILYYLYYCIT